MPRPGISKKTEPDTSPATIEHKCPACGSKILGIEPDDVLDLGYEAECEKGCLVVVESVDPVAWAEIDDDEVEELDADDDDEDNDDDDEDNDDDDDDDLDADDDDDDE